MTRCSGVFFFSSRRRHTRLVSDWSSDVCSSDLGEWIGEGSEFGGRETLRHKAQQCWSFREGAVFCHQRGHAPFRVYREIGRASCRERVEMSVGGGGLKDKRKATGVWWQRGGWRE